MRQPARAQAPRLARLLRPAPRQERGLVRAGKACIAYRVVSGVMLASGDPLGDPEAWPGAIAAFVREARRHAWTPAVIGCSERAGQVWCRETGLDALELGDEAVVEVADVLPRGPADAQRAADGQAGRAGRLHDRGLPGRATCPPGSAAGPCADAAAWRVTETERGFSMALGRFGDPADADCVGGHRAQDGGLRAFLQFVPWGTDGLSLDLMRRDRDRRPRRQRAAHRARAAGAPALGVTRVSLNFAVFRSALERGERLGAGPLAAGVAPGAASSPRAGSRSSRSTGSTPSSSPAGSRGSSSTRTSATCPGSRWPRSRPRRSSSGPRCAG